MAHLSETARLILSALADGQTIGEILHTNPRLQAKDIASAAQEALHLDKFNHETTSRKAGDTNLRTYEVWTADEDAKLQQMMADDTPIQEMSKVLQRHPMIVRRRMRQLELNNYL